MTRYVGIDLAKRSMQVCAVKEDGAEIERRGLLTDERGRQMLCSFLRKEDIVGMEACGYANKLARMLEKQVGCEVYLLNPGALVMVWKSRKKTDKEDALKIAKYLRDTPLEEMLEVPLLSEEEELFRSDITMKEFLKKERGMAINRLHGLYGNERIIDVTRADLKDEEGRRARHGELPARSQVHAQILEESGPGRVCGGISAHLTGMAGPLWAGNPA
jgi:transposase